MHVVCSTWTCCLYIVYICIYLENFHIHSTNFLCCFFQLDGKQCETFRNINISALGTFPPIWQLVSINKVILNQRSTPKFPLDYVRCFPTTIDIVPIAWSLLEALIIWHILELLKEGQVKAHPMSSFITWQTVTPTHLYGGLMPYAPL